jgi:hypothetical protein
MLTALSFVKGFFSKLIAFVIENWQLVLFALMALAIWHYKCSYDNEKSAYANYVQQTKNAAYLEAIKNSIVENNTQAAVALEIQKHKNAITALKVNEAELKKKVSDLYAVKTNADYRLASYHDRLLLETNDSGTSANSATDTEKLAACRRELDTADSRQSTIEEACAVTTADFNLARGWIDSVCANHKCTGEVRQ